MDSTWIPGRFHLEFGRILAGFQSTWIRVNLVGIWWESFPVQVKFGWALTRKIFPPNSYQAPGFRLDSSDSAWKRWGTVKYSAEQLEVQVLDMSKKLLGAEHPETLRSMGNLAFIHKSKKLE